jgi:hypothetical protein
MTNADIQMYPTIPARRVDQEGFFVREDVLYSDAKGCEKSKLRKSARVVLDAFGDVLRRVLEKDETILYIAPAQAMPGALGQFFGGGWHTQSLPRTILFLTDRRIITLRVRKRMSGWDWNRGIWTARWGDVEKAIAGGLVSRYLTLKFRNGETRQYWRFGWGSLKKVRMVVEALRAQTTGESTAAGGAVSLCPHCLATLAPRTYRCPSCSVEFKNEKTLLQRALVVPGGASLYVGANGLGMLRAAFESLITISIVISLFELTRTPKGSGREAALMSSIVIECAVLFVDKLMAYYLALPQIRDFIPID